MHSFGNKMCGITVYSSWPSTLKSNLIWQDLLVLLFLALHYIQLFLIEHSEVKLINVLQTTSEDVRIPAVAQVRRMTIRKDAGILSSQAVMFHGVFFYSYSEYVFHKITLYCNFNTCLLLPWMIGTRQHGASGLFQMGYATRAESSFS